VLSSRDVEKLPSKKSMYLPNVNSLLKISLGLVLFTIISSALVYAETITVNVDGTSYDIDYTVTGMTVSGVEADTDFISLIFTVDVTDSPGVLDITFDRSFFDSIFEGADDDFIILADGDEPTSTETEITSQSRTLNIELPAGTEEVEIIGSSFDNTVSIPTDDSDADKAAADKAAADKAAADKAAADKAAADKAAADKAAADDTPKTQCGPGTILKNGACVLDERCGPGTILKDGVCVVESTPKSSNTSVSGLGKDLGMGLIAAIVIAGVIAIVLGIAAKANKSSN
jgi:hypothetical protein